MNRLFAAFTAFAVLALAPATFAQEGEVDVAKLEGKVASIEEQLLETKANVDALRKLRITGYVQARWAWLELGTGANPPNAYNTTPDAVINQQGFFIRRGRFKAVYDSDWSQFVMQLDAIPTGLSLKEGYAAIKLPQGFGLDVGLQLFPFGYEVFSRSSSDLDTLERARVTRAFAGGEYDVGAALRGNLGLVGLKNFNFKVGLFNGNGVDGAAGRDNDNLKDVIGRVTADFGFLTAGASGWYGKVRDWTRADDKEFDRLRVAVDAQLYLDLLPFGGTALKGEWMWGRTTIGTGAGGAGGNLPAATSNAPVPTGNGWYAIVTQNVGDHNQVAAKFEQYTPNLTASVDGATNATVKTQQELQLALHTFVGEGGKVTVAWFHPMNGEKGDAALSDPKSDQLLVQVQAKF